MNSRERFHIPESEITWRFSRSSGPGGQSVNTSDSRVELIWSLDDSQVLSRTQKDRAEIFLGNRLVDGTLTIKASEYKSQHRNREAARVRLQELLARAVAPPRPRRPTKPSKASRQRRIDSKKKRSQTKKLRQRPE